MRGANITFSFWKGITPPDRKYFAKLFNECEEMQVRGRFLPALAALLLSFTSSFCSLTLLLPELCNAFAPHAQYLVVVEHGRANLANEMLEMGFKVHLWATMSGVKQQGRCLLLLARGGRRALLILKCCQAIRYNDARSHLPRRRQRLHGLLLLQAGDPTRLGARARGARGKTRCANPS